MTDDIEKLPAYNKRLGSCPECGHSIWASDRTHYKQLNTGTGSTDIAIYKCIECGEEINVAQIIPF